MVAAANVEWLKRTSYDFMVWFGLWLASLSGNESKVQPFHLRGNKKVEIFSLCPLALEPVEETANTVERAGTTRRLPRCD